jgi:hypothetical protein
MWTPVCLTKFCQFPHYYSFSSHDLVYVGSDKILSEIYNAEYKYEVSNFRTTTHRVRGGK